VNSGNTLTEISNENAEGNPEPSPKGKVQRLTSDVVYTISIVEAQNYLWRILVALFLMNDGNISR